MTADPNRIAVGRIVGAFGVRGELKCDPTRAGRALFQTAAELRCVRGDDAWDVRLEAVRAHKGRLLIRIGGVDDAEAASTYAGAVLFAPRASIALEEGEYLDDDLVGCTVLGPNGTPYGVVERVEHYPSSDMLVVAGTMVPMVRAIVTNVDLGSRRIAIDPPAGLFD
jgi:16S rRNA processing protein RimM